LNLPAERGRFRSISAQVSPMLITRRTLVLTMAATPFALDPAVAQGQPIGLRLVRRVGWQEQMGKSRCVVGDLYRSNPNFPATELGSKVCTALELAYRNPANEIGPIPRGDYGGFVRTDGPRGWRIELKGAAPRASKGPDERSNIQLHVGNRPSETVGCLVPGTADSAGTGCSIAGTPAALDRLKAAVGSAAGRKVLLRVQT